MGPQPFVIHVAQLRRLNGSCQQVARSGPIDPNEGVGPPGPGDSSIQEGELVTCEIELQSFPGGVMATGTVIAPWSGTCRRCTGAVSGELRVGVRERFVDPDKLMADDDAYPIVEDRLDLEPMVHDAVVLELPTAPLCREDCAGLCPWCGIDRNQETCQCAEPRDPRWASLEVLRSGSLGQTAEPVRERR